MIPEDPYAYVVAAFQAPQSPEYVLDPEHPPSPKFVPEPVYLKLSHQRMRCCQLKSLPAAVLPTAGSPRYILESDPEEDPKEDPVDYPADGGDDDDDDDGSSDDDDDDVEDDEDEHEEEEHPAPADSIPPPPLVHRVTARLSIGEQPPTPVWSEAEIDRLIAIPSPPPSPLSPWSSPLPQITSPPLLVSPPLPVSSSPLHARLLKNLHTQIEEFQRQHRPAKGPAQPDAYG
nr:hypothetical protein [Tanacetum cinerariifolium]